jgi:formate dehydrogenase iron-sulfur subunit
MSNSRRTFLKSLTGAGSLLLFGNKKSAHSSIPKVDPDQFGVLVDTTRCVGCRQCEKACNSINEDLPPKAAADFKDKSVFNERRRMDYSSYTVVNRYKNINKSDKPVYAKFQCMHCLYPACVSACIVGAFTREKDGAITYDAWKCIGCRYCMAACPFQVPAYEFANVLTPQVRKCTFCFNTRLSKGQIPACVESCHMEVMKFGKRIDLIKYAYENIKNNPNRYLPQVYGEKEVGGTSWLYLSSIPFQSIDLPKLGYHPAPGYTEPIQHTIFKWFLPQLGVYATLGGIWWFLKAKKKKEQEDSQELGN